MIRRLERRRKKGFRRKSQLEIACLGRIYNEINKEHKQKGDREREIEIERERERERGGGGGGGNARRIFFK